jgi:hypothetical protein
MLLCAKKSLAWGISTRGHGLERFHISREEIRTPALVGAGVIAALVAVEFFGKKLAKPK